MKKSASKKIFDKNLIAYWNENFQKLVDFKKKFGNCDVPNIWKKDNTLAKWARVQKKTKHTLPAELKEKLIRLGFDFSDSPFIWDEKYEELYEFSKTKGHIYLPLNDPKYTDLKDWLALQVLSKDYLPQDRFDKLDLLGVEWESKTIRDFKWEIMYGKLRAFKKQHGHCKVPQKWEKDPQLSNWVCVQRRTHASGKLPSQRKKKLEALGFVWDFRKIYNAQWSQFYHQIVEFKKQHGHCAVPGKYKKLASWVERQRTSRSKGKLSKEREKKLTKIGFIWDFKEINERAWQEKYHQLVAFRKEHGHCFVPVNWKENPSLGCWISTQRGLEAKGKLAPEKKKSLDRLGFVWRKDALRKLNELYESQWEENYEKLKSYHKRFKTCQVSLKIDPSLQRWTSIQRRLYNENKLSGDRVNKLNKLGFPWNIQRAYWTKMYRSLVDFHRRFGHLKVPWGWEEDQHLAPWVQRTRLNKHELDPQKIKLLNAIGFDWTLKRRVIRSWEDMYERLIKFKLKHGHTRVPVQWKEDRKLGKWVSRMRFIKDELPKEKKDRLNAVGFDWGSRNLSNEKMKKLVSA